MSEPELVDETSAPEVMMAVFAPQHTIMVGKRNVPPRTVVHLPVAEAESLMARRRPGGLASSRR